MEVRLTAAECLLEYIGTTKDSDALIRLLKSIKIRNRDDWGRRARQSISDQETREIDSPAIKWRLAQKLCDRPLFTRMDSASNPLNRKEVFDQFIDLLARGGLIFDLKLVSAILDSVVIMFGIDQPSFYSAMEIQEEQSMEGSGLADVIPAMVQRTGLSSGSASISVRATRDDDEEMMIWENPPGLDSMGDDLA